jgi:hypothetical protein
LCKFISTFTCRSQSLVLPRSATHFPVPKVWSCFVPSWSFCLVLICPVPPVSSLCAVPQSGTVLSPVGSCSVLLLLCSVPSVWSCSPISCSPVRSCYVKSTSLVLFCPILFPQSGPVPSCFCSVVLSQSGPVLLLSCSLVWSCSVLSPVWSCSVLSPSLVLFCPLLFLSRVLIRPVPVLSCPPTPSLVMSSYCPVPQSGPVLSHPVAPFWSVPLLLFPQSGPVMSCSCSVMFHQSGSVLCCP